MNWIDNIYKVLDKKYENELKMYKTSTEEIVKDMWLALRNRLNKDDAEDVMINRFGTFYMKSQKLFSLLFLNVAFIDAERESPEPNIWLLKGRVNLIKRYVTLYNLRLKYNKIDKRSIEYNEEENKVYKGGEVVTIKSYEEWVTNIKRKNVKRRLKKLGKQGKES